MGTFTRIALLKAHQKFEPVDATYTSDLTELCHLGAFIEKDVESVSIPLTPYDHTPFKTFAKSLKREKFDFVGISAMTAGYNNAREYARIAKAAGAYVVLGGYHPTALTEDVLADPNVDAVVRGEAEFPLRNLIVNGPGEDIEGLSFKRKNEQVHNPDHSLIYELDQLPQPLRKIRPNRFGEPGDAYSIDTVYSSRGCIAKCTFCANDTMNQGFRPRSPEHFIEELEQIHSTRVRKIIKFWDSIFLFDPKRVEKIIELMFKRNLTNFCIYTESRSDDVIRCEHLMEDLKRVGFEKIQIGIESPDKATFKTLRKGGSVENHEKAIQILRDARIRTDGFLIIGHPHETEEDIKRYPEFAVQSGLNYQAQYFVMTPYPGTQIYSQYLEKNLIESFDWDCYNNFGTVVHLENLERAQLRNLLTWCYGSTAGPSYWFQKQKSVPRFVLQLFYMMVFWLYFYDLQGVKSVKSRNEFIGTFFRAALGRFNKKRKAGILGRFYQLFSKTFNIRFKISDQESYVMAFQMKRKEIDLEVRRAEESDGKMITATLDDMDYSHNAIDMSDANGLMFFFEKDAPWYLRVRQFVYCLPLIGRTVSTLLKVFWNMGRRYLIPPSVVIPGPVAPPAADGEIREVNTRNKVK